MKYENIINRSRPFAGHATTILRATLVAAALAVAAPASASTSEVVIRTPGAGDTEAIRSVHEVPEAMAQELGAA